MSEPTTETPPDVLDTPSGPQTTYKSLSLEAHRDADNGRWLFGVTMGGAFVPLYQAKLGGIDDDLQEAATPGFKQGRAERYQREVLGNG